jgi:hypothetical protein
MKSPILLPLALLLLLPASAIAQRGGGSGPRPAPPPTVAPPIQPPSGPAAISVPSPLAGQQPGPRDLYQRPDGGDRFQHLQLFPFLPYGGGGGYSPGYYPGGVYPPGYVEMPGQFAPRPAPQRGGLRVEILPASAQVFVDGSYVGLAEDFGIQGRSYDLPAGQHRVELRAPGYETASFDINTSANETTRYRGDLKRIESSAAPRSAGPTRPLYIIPNCYAGNKPPKRVPKGCSTAGMQVIK